MTKKDVDFTKITRDASFLRIAKAINQATVYAGKVTTKDGVKELDWQRNYGLAQLLSSQSGSKKDFICAIADFLGKYEHENLRLSEKYLNEGKRLKRVSSRTKENETMLSCATQGRAIAKLRQAIALDLASSGLNNEKFWGKFSK